MSKNTNKLYGKLLLLFTKNQKTRRKYCRNFRKTKKGGAKTPVFAPPKALKGVLICCGQLAVFHKHNTVGTLCDSWIVCDHKKRLSEFFSHF